MLIVYPENCGQFKANTPYVHEGTLYTIIRVRTDASKQCLYIGSFQDYEKHKTSRYLANKKYKQTTNGRLKQIAKQLIDCARKRIQNRKRGILTITSDWIVPRLARGKCELTQLDFNLAPNSNLVPSLDRINSKNYDYSPENCRLVLRQVNVALNAWTEQESLPVFKALVQAIEAKQLY